MRASATILGGVSGIVTVASIYLRLVIANGELRLEARMREWVSESFVKREAWEEWREQLEREQSRRLNRREGR